MPSMADWSAPLPDWFGPLDPREWWDKLVRDAPARAGGGGEGSGSDPAQRSSGLDGSDAIATTAAAQQQSTRLYGMAELLRDAKKLDELWATQNFARQARHASMDATEMCPVCFESAIPRSRRQPPFYRSSHWQRLASGEVIWA